MEYKFIFSCELINKTKTEESFEFETVAKSLISAKSNLDDLFQKNWGWIVKRIYENEHMISDRYWTVRVISIKELLAPKTTKREGKI